MPVFLIDLHLRRRDPDRARHCNAARAAMYPDILTGDLYVLGTAVTLTTSSSLRSSGSPAGGAIVPCSASGPHCWGLGHLPRLGPDHPTLVRARPHRPHHAAEPLLVAVGSQRGFRLVFGNPALRTPMLLAGSWRATTYPRRGGPLPSHSAAETWRRAYPGCGALGASLGRWGSAGLVGPQKRLRWMTRIAPLAPGRLILFASIPFGGRPCHPHGQRNLRLLSGRRQRPGVRATPRPAKPRRRNLQAE